MKSGLRATFKRDRMQIEHFTIICQRLESVREAFRNKQSLVVGGAQDFGVPLEERGRAVAKIDGDVEYLTTQAAYQLHFRMGRMLKVHPSYSASLGRERVIYLNDASLTHQRLQLVRAENALEESAAVAYWLALDDLNAGERSSCDIEPVAHDRAGTSKASI